jgi:hypothetical protein
VKLTLRLLPDLLAVCQLDPDNPFPNWAQGNNLLTFTRTTDELSIVCENALVPENITAERGWRALKVQGQLDFSQVGIISDLTKTLAEARISIFTISTFNTDYLLLKDHNLSQGLKALRKSGYTISDT